MWLSVKVLLILGHSWDLNPLRQNKHPFSIIFCKSHNICAKILTFLPIYWSGLVSFEWALIGGQTGRGLSALGNVHSAVASKQSFSSDWEVGMTQPLSHLKLVPTCARCLPLMDPFLSRNLSHVVVLKFKLMQFNLLFTVLNLSYLAHESKGWLVMCSPITNDLTIN